MSGDIANRLRALKANTMIFMGELKTFAAAADALDAKDKRIADLDAALLMNPMAERIADLPDFMVALSEWGCDDPSEQADEITKFLSSTTGLREYLEDQSKAGGRDGN